MTYLAFDANSSIISVASDIIGGINYPDVKITDGTLGSTNVLKVNSDGSINASIIGTLQIASIAGSVNVASIIGAVTLYAQPNSFVSGVSSVITSTTATSVLSAPGVGVRNYITEITFTNAAAVGTFVDVKDSGANILYSGYAAASGGGVAATFNVPIVQPTTNASIDVISRTQASIIAAISGYKAL